MTNPFSSPAKIVLTGASDGIGQVLCSRFLDMGHEVVAVARGAESMARAKGLHPIACDLTDFDALQRACDRIAADHPDTAILINNAAFQYDRALSDFDLDVRMLAAEVKLNLLAPAVLIQQLLPVMRARGTPAAIVNVNSGLAIFPKQRTALYCATKAGLHSMTQSLRYQLEGTGTAVHEVFLPLVDTSMTKGRGGDKISAEYAADRIVQGLLHGDRRIWVGKARLLPIFARLAPGIGRRILRGPV